MIFYLSFMFNIKKLVTKFVNTQNGFALIEQIIVLTIISLLSIATIVAFSDITIKQKQKTSINELFQNIRKIQNYAMTGRVHKNDFFVPYYGIYIVNKNEYLLFSDLNNNFIFDDNDYVLEQIKLASGISIEPEMGVFGSVAPSGGFCYDNDNIFEQTICNSKTIFIIKADNIENKKIITNHLSGSVSFYEE